MNQRSINKPKEFSLFSSVKKTKM